MKAYGLLALLVVLGPPISGTPAIAQVIPEELRQFLDRRDERREEFRELFHELRRGVFACTGRATRGTGALAFSSE